MSGDRPHEARDYERFCGLNLPTPEEEQRELEAIERSIQEQVDEWREEEAERSRYDHQRPHKTR